MSLTEEEMVLYTENPNDSRKELLGLINSVKLIHKNQFCFYTLTLNYLKKKIENDSIYSSVKIYIKYLGTNLTKGVQ